MVGVNGMVRLTVAGLEHREHEYSCVLPHTPCTDQTSLAYLSSLSMLSATAIDWLALVLHHYSHLMPRQFETT